MSDEKERWCHPPSEGIVKEHRTRAVQDIIDDLKKTRLGSDFVREGDREICRHCGRVKKGTAAWFKEHNRECVKPRREGKKVEHMGKMKKIDIAVKDICDQIHESCENLDRPVYMAVLEEVMTELEGRLEAAKEEEAADADADALTRAAEEDENG